MAYQNGLLNSLAAAVLRWNVKAGLVKDRTLVDDAEPNNWTQFTDNPAATGKIPYLTGADANGVTQFPNPGGVGAYGLNLSQLATPGVPVITTAGTAGAQTWTYKIVARSGFGATLGMTPASTGGSTTTGNATLTTANFNIITFPSVPGAVAYDVYRTAAGTTPSTTGKIGTVSATFAIGGAQPATYVLNDTALAADSTTAPTVNTTGIVNEPVISGDLNILQLTTPVNVVATPQGTVGSTTITYKIVARNSVGVTAASSAGTTTTANATLATANNVLVTWNPVPGAVSYDVYRTAAGGTPSTTGKLANVLASTGTSYTDIGAAGDTTTAPTVNTTGAITTPGPVTFGQLADNTTDSAISSSTAIGAVSMINGILRVTGGTDTSTTDTAANIVAAIPNCQVGSSFLMYVINGSGAVHTLGLGTSVTAAAGVTVTLTTATASSKCYLFRVTNVGTPAVTIYSLGVALS